MNLLIVDDSVSMRKIIKNTLNQNLDKFSFSIEEIYESKDGAEAMQVLKENSKIDMILLDWIMPNMDGFEFLEIIEADENYKSIPVIMITTEGRKDEVVKAIKHGAKAYICKPFQQTELVKKVDDIYKKYCC
ncbi:MAG: two-component system response regulator [Planctomycetota bacterium]|nr:MAG: two-component system response regulator [Planctomycetota bacterium]